MTQDTFVLLDFGDAERLEQWGPYRLRRPDPTAVGMPQSPKLWVSVDAAYEGEKGKGRWVCAQALPPEWPVHFGDLSLLIRLAPYKHTGVFPEQEQNWRWARQVAKKKSRSLSILNLFAYTGGATVALAKDEHFVTHVDASRPAIGWAKENAALNAIGTDRIRWILEDAPSFVKKELKRGKTYDAIVLDPPAYGHGTQGKTWRVERDLAPLLEDCCLLLSHDPAFVILNGYAQHDTPESFRRLLTGILHTKTPQTQFSIEAETLCLQSANGERLETGTVTRCGFG